MEKTEKYLQAESVVIQPEKYDHRDVNKAQSYLDAYQDGYTKALSLSDVVECKHGDTEAVYFKEGDFAYVVCASCRKVVE